VSGKKNPGKVLFARDVAKVQAAAENLQPDAARQLTSVKGWYAFPHGEGYAGVA
jgi:hypothetical protein